MTRKKNLQFEKDKHKIFNSWAKKVIKGEVLIPPLHLSEEERRKYVRATLREDHTYRIENKPEDTEAKFDKLKDSYFSFFRGTALLYYRDYAGIDHDLPQVFTVGDAHPENFGVMPNEDNVPFFGVNDFDEAHFAPFSWDIRRGSTGFWLAAKEEGHSKKDRKKIVRHFVKGYLDGLKEFDKDDRERFFQYRIDNSPKIIRKLMEGALEERKDFLEEKIKLEQQKFHVTDEIVPHSKHIKEFQEVIDRYVKENKIKAARGGKNFFKVKDVAIKKGSGTASLGLDRFWVLINGEANQPDRCIILEMKQARRSAIKGLVPETSKTRSQNIAQRIVQAHSIHLAGGDAFYGYVEYQDKSYLVRERSPFKDDIDIEELSTKDFKKYARICGKTLAQTHARSDKDTGVTTGNAESDILDSIIPEIFVEDMVRFAKSSAKRVLKDHKLFQKDYNAGAFKFTGS